MSTVINKILFTSDLTKYSVKVFEQAVALALQTGAAISMIHVVQEEPDATYKGEFIDWLDQDLGNRIRKKRQAKAKDILIGKQTGMVEIQNALKEYFEKTGKKIEGQQITVDAIEVNEGNASLAIPEFAEVNGCDLIIMGYRKEGSFLRAVMENGGSIIKRNKINILLVPLEE